MVSRTGKYNTSDPQDSHKRWREIVIPNYDPAEDDKAWEIADRIYSQINRLGVRGHAHDLFKKGKHGTSPIVREVGAALDKGDGWLEGLFRSYKHAPHAPTSLLLKYIVHRVNNFEHYHDPKRAALLDGSFLALHSIGEAGDSNRHVTAEDLHSLLSRNHHLIAHLLQHRAELHALIKRGVGLNLREINGETYVALNRGLDSPVMTDEHALSSWADNGVNNEFGTTQHAAWIPLHDVWYSYDLGMKSASSGQYGAEDEYLVSYSRPRYRADIHDITPTKFRRGFLFEKDPIFVLTQLDEVTDKELAWVVEHEPNLDVDDIELEYIANHPNSGPLTTEAFRKKLPSYEFTTEWLATSKHAKPEEWWVYFNDKVNTWRRTWGAYVLSPSLQAADLHKLLDNESMIPQSHAHAFSKVMKHPAVDDSIRERLFDLVKRYRTEDKKLSIEGLMEAYKGLTPEYLEKFWEAGLAGYLDPPGSFGVSPYEVMVRNWPVPDTVLRKLPDKILPELAQNENLTAKQYRWLLDNRVRGPKWLGTYHQNLHTQEDFQRELADWYIKHPTLREANEQGEFADVRGSEILYKELFSNRNQLKLDLSTQIRVLDAVPAEERGFFLSSNFRRPHSHRLLWHYLPDALKARLSAGEKFSPRLSLAPKDPDIPDWLGPYSSTLSELTGGQKFLDSHIIKDLPSDLSKDEMPAVRPEQFDPELVKVGMEHELQHTTDYDIALQTALEKLIKDPEYYSKPTIRKDELPQSGPATSEEEPPQDVFLDNLPEEMIIGAWARE